MVLSNSSCSRPPSEDFFQSFSVHFTNHCQGNVFFKSLNTNPLNYSGIRKPPNSMNKPGLYPTQSDRIKQYFCIINLIPKEPLAEHFAHLTMVCSVSLKIFFKNGQVENKRRSGRPKRRRKKNYSS